MDDYIPLQPAHEPDYETWGTEAERDEGDEEPEFHHCPFCDHDGMTIDHIRKCSGYQSSGMPNNQTGHYYGCGCPDCMTEYQSLK